MQQVPFVKIVLPKYFSIKCLRIWETPFPEKHNNLISEIMRIHMQRFRKGKTLTLGVFNSVM